MFQEKTTPDRRHSMIMKVTSHHLDSDSHDSAAVIGSNSNNSSSSSSCQICICSPSDEHVGVDGHLSSCQEPQCIMTRPHKAQVRVGRLTKGFSVRSSMYLMSVIDVCLSICVCVSLSLLSLSRLSIDYLSQVEGKGEDWGLYFCLSEWNIRTQIEAQILFWLFLQLTKLIIQALSELNLVSCQRHLKLGRDLVSQGLRKIHTTIQANEFVFISCCCIDKQVSRLIEKSLLIHAFNNWISRASRRPGKIDPTCCALCMVCNFTWLLLCHASN